MRSRRDTHLLAASWRPWLGPLSWSAQLAGRAVLLAQPHPLPPAQSHSPRHPRRCRRPTPPRPGLPRRRLPRRQGCRPLQHLSGRRPAALAHARAGGRGARQPPQRRLHPQSGLSVRVVGREGSEHRRKPAGNAPMTSSSLPRLDMVASGTVRGVPAATARVRDSTSPRGRWGATRVVAALTCASRGNAFRSVRRLVYV
jgi:hypothetical protein